MPGFYADWVILERTRLFNLYENKLSQLITLLNSKERWSDVIQWALLWIANAGWSEFAYRSLMQAYAYSGELSKSISTFEQLANGLMKDLNVEPSDQTLALYQLLKSRPHTSPSPPLLEQYHPFNEKQIEAIMPEEQRTLPLHPNPPNPITSFIGRQLEIQLLQQQLRENRLSCFH